MLVYTIRLVCKLLLVCILLFLDHRSLLYLIDIIYFLHPQVSTVYNKAIATSNTEIIVNSVIVLFIMDLDEWIFSALEAINDDWTSHVAKSEDEMKVQIASQQEELKNLREIVERIQDSLTQMDQIASEKEELRKLHEIVDKMLESNASSAHSEHVVSGSESDVYAQQLETEHVDDIVVPYEA